MKTLSLVLTVFGLLQIGTAQKVLNVDDMHPTGSITYYMEQGKVVKTVFSVSYDGVDYPDTTCLGTLLEQEQCAYGQLVNWMNGDDPANIADPFMEFDSNSYTIQLHTSVKGASKPSTSTVHSPKPNTNGNSKIEHSTEERHGRFGD